MNMIIDSSPSNFMTMIMLEKSDKKRKSRARKNYMRNILYEEYNIERNDDEYDGYGNYESPWCQ